MRLLTIAILLVLVAILSSCSGQVRLFTVDHYRTGVKYHGARGTIFNDQYPFALFFLDATVDSTKRWTPDAEDIKLAEHILKTHIKTVDRSHWRHFGPRIRRNLKNYFRQYVGIRNERGQKLIHVNMLWDRLTITERLVGNDDARPDYTSAYSILMKGSSYYWTTEVNLDEKTLRILSKTNVDENKK